MKEGRRKPGSEWLKDHPEFLERAYAWTQSAFRVVYPLVKRVAPRTGKHVVTWAEEVGKGYLFNCQMCGQCILHSTGMTCPMTCPKNLRNGPCGGVRHDGHCEVIPERMCVWVQAWERSRRMPVCGEEIMKLQPPVNYGLQDTASWINWLEGVDVQTPTGWVPLGELDA